MQGHFDYRMKLEWVKGRANETAKEASTVIIIIIIQCLNVSVDMIIVKA